MIGDAQTTCLDSGVPHVPKYQGELGVTVLYLGDELAAWAKIAQAIEQFHTRTGTSSYGVRARPEQLHRTFSRPHELVH